MEISLEGRSALITGGSKGLGLATAHRFAQSGANVAIVARNPQQLDLAVAQIRAQSARGSNRVEGYVCDVSQSGDVEAAFARVEAAFVQVDILVNNAGQHAHGQFETLTDAQWQADFDLKVFAPIRFMRLAVPGMKRRGWGRIINGINVFAKAPRAMTAPTSVSRAATMALTKALAGECAPHNVLVNSLVIGVLESDQMRRMYVASGSSLPYEEYMIEKALSLGIPMGRPGRAEDFANMACFLASDAAPYITGTAINVDGGLCPVV